ncbi:MAG: LysM peptidoglycan-binding domain-containing protein [Deltaproteobacteria bacterium]|nr:LysM peptidoglycan-binding domain-containing protein [Deltaproteobacteria bacterium]
MISRATWLASGLLLASGLAAAGELRHEVQPDQTLGEISQLYYGDARYAEVIRCYNGLDSSPIRAQSQLSMPQLEQHTVTAGDSWSALALRYWGDASLHRELALYATGRSDAALKVGQKLRIGPLISYRLASGDTLASVSRRFYGHPDRATALARLNRVKHPRRLQVGARVKVPIAELGSAAAAPPSPEPAVRVEVAAAPVPDRFEAALQRALNTQLDGRYDDALEQLEALRPTILAEGSRSERVFLLEQLTFVYAAFDRDEDVCNGYRALLQLEPQLEWDGDRISPKILRLVARCQGG